MDTPYKAVNLILNNGKDIEETLFEIEELNTLRKTKTLEHTLAALENINPQDNLIIYHSENIEHGIIGIVAGRLTEKYFKPAIVLIDEGEKLVASCRSPDYFSLIEILERYKDMFLAFGGHKNAAGFSIAKELFPTFREKILEEVNTQDFSGYKKEILVDKIVPLDEIGFHLVDSMNRFKPFGMGNPKPLFLIEDFIPQKISFLGQGREHLKLEHRYGFKIFAFGLGEYYDILKQHTSQSLSLRLVVDISQDNWQ